MWIEELEVRGYRRLRGTWRFGPGLTVVVGDNEAGKSTLHEALVRVLFGFTRAERRRHGGASVKDRCAPWTGGEFGLRATLREARGRSLHVAWDFQDHTVRVVELDGGGDLSAEVRGKNDDVQLGEWLLNLGLEDFRAACCLAQADVGRVEPRESLVLALREAVESREPAGGVEAAVRALGEFASRELGLHARHLTPLPKGRQAALTAERAEVAGRLAAHARVRAELERLAEDLRAAEGAAAAAEGRLQDAERALLAAELRDVEHRLAEVRRLEVEAQPSGPPVARLPARGVAAAQGLLASLARVDAAMPAARERAAAARAVLLPLLERRAELDVELGPDEPGGGDAGLPESSLPSPEDAAGEAAVRELRARWITLVESPRPGSATAAPPRDPRLERWRRERDALHARVAGPPPGLWTAAAALLAAAGVAGAAAVHPAFLALAGLAVLAFLEGRRRAASRRAEVDRAVRACGGASAGELDALAAAEDRLLEDVAAAAAAAGAHEAAVAEECARAETELAALLDRLGASRAGALRDRADAWLRRCEVRARRAAAGARRQALQGRIAAASEPVRECERLEREAAALRAELEVVQRELGIAAADPARAAAELDRRLRREREEDERLARADAARETLGRLLDGDTPEGLERRAAAAREQLRRHPRGSPAAEDERAEGDGEGLRERVRGRAAAARAAALEAAALRERVREREQQLASLDAAELEERLAELDRRIAGIERAGRAVRIARDALEEAARETHRRFAPHLRDALVRHLPTITNGRYRDALVGEDLTLQVRAPECGEYVRVDELSRGTRDQIYLLERLEIARLLDPTTGEAPLLLDDPFARSDGTRVRLGLRVLREFAVERQVVLFSEDPELARAAQRVTDGCVVIELPPPDEGAPPALPPRRSPAAAPARPERGGVREQQADLWTAPASHAGAETPLGRAT